MYKELDVVMLPTNQKTPIYIDSVIGLVKALQDRLVSGLKYQHLYFTFNVPIKEGDWYLNGSHLYQADRHYQRAENDKKIIATTDEKISINLGLEKWIAPTNSSYDQIYTRLCPYPQPSQSFVNAYIKDYNNGKPITKVMVEYEQEWITTIDLMDGGDSTFEYILKINPDNTINNKFIPVKDEWNKSEVDNLLRKMYYDATGKSTGNTI